MAARSEVDDTSAGSKRPHRTTGAFELLTAASMTVGRAASSRAIVDLANPGPHDRALDIGCGPGAAARMAANRCEAVTAVDPGRWMLRLGRWITSLRRLENVSFSEGSAEELPLRDSEVTVSWSLSSVHHWDDRGRALTEVFRTLAPGGKVLLAERLVKSGARGHAAHGLTQEAVELLARDLVSAGFEGVTLERLDAGRRRLVVAVGTRPPAR